MRNTALESVTTGETAIAAAGPAGGRTLRVFLVDPSLFTGTYDAALTEGLVACGVDPIWATRPTRTGDRQEIPQRYVDPFFYRRVDEAAGLPGPLRILAKGVAHALGMARLVGRVRHARPDAVHVQWVVLPLVDVIAFWFIRRRARLVLTVHDTVPFNGIRISWTHKLGFDAPIHLAHRVVVHTGEGRERLVARGVKREKISVIPHGPFRLHAKAHARSTRDPRWTFVLFGEIKAYKGVDLMVQAVSQLEPALRARCRVIVAGRPRMDMAPIEALIGELGLSDTIELRLHRHTEQEMADLFDEADAFVFPYRQVDASGVYFHVKALGKWVIASRVGVFAEEVREGVDGELLPREDVAALGDALAANVQRRPRAQPLPASSNWVAIGERTRALYAADSV